jgi:hypothetical protein
MPTSDWRDDSLFRNQARPPAPAPAPAARAAGAAGASSATHTPAGGTTAPPGAHGGRMAGGSVGAGGSNNGGGGATAGTTNSQQQQSQEGEVKLNVTIPRWATQEDPDKADGYTVRPFLISELSPCADGVRPVDIVLLHTACVDDTCGRCCWCAHGRCTACS